MSEIEDLKMDLAALSDRVGQLEDTNAIRKLHYATDITSISANMTKSYSCSPATG